MQFLHWSKFNNLIQNINVNTIVQFQIKFTTTNQLLF